MAFPNGPLLVTGAGGWLGKRLMKHLEQAPGEVRCFVLPGQATSLGRAITVEGNLQRPADCERLCAGACGGVLFHLAGIIHPQRVREFYAVNVNATRQVLRAADAAGVRRVIVMSSNSPCGSNPHPSSLFDETSPYHPYMNYGRSKMQMEQMVKREFGQSPLEVVIIRAPWFYGPEQPERQTRFFHMIRQGMAPLVGDGTNRRSMAYIDNLCDGLLLAATTERARGQTYWLADERPYTMNEIIDTVRNLLENELGLPCKPQRLRLPSVVSTAARVIDGCVQALGLYSQAFHVLSEMNQTIACSVEKAKRDLGYLPKVHLEEGMRRSLRWCQDMGIPL